MELNTSHKLTNVDVLTLIEAASTAEKHRDIQKLQEILQPVWDDIGTEPDYEKYEPFVKAELYRLSGAFLTHYASARRLNDVQLLAKNLLTKSICIFEQLDAREKIGEANVSLGYAYANCGEIKNYEDIYNCIEAEFEPDHPIQMSVICNRLLICIFTNETEQGEKLIETSLHKFSECDDLPLKARLHTNAGIICRRGKNFDGAVDHFNKAAELSCETGILSYEAVNYNNLALLYRDQEEFEKAHASAQKALQICFKLNDKGLIPKFLDTEALIFLAEKKYEQALQTVKEALKYFLQGEDYNYIADSYWTKTLCLLRLARYEDAYAEFGTLMNIAAVHIDSDAVKKFARLFHEQVYVPPPLPLPEKIAAFTKHFVKKALRQNGLKVTKSALALGFTHHEGLRKILKKYSELYEELGMPRPKQRKSKKLQTNVHTRTVEVFQPTPKGRIVILRPDDIREEKVIELNFEKANISYNFDYSDPFTETYYLSEDLMRKLGVESDAVVAVAPLLDFEQANVILIRHEDGFLVGRVEQDKFSEVYFLVNEDEWIPLDETNVIGIPIGYCINSEVTATSIEFTQLKFK